MTVNTPEPSHTCARITIIIGAAILLFFAWPSPALPAPPIVPKRTWHTQWNQTEVAAPYVHDLIMNGTIPMAGYVTYVSQIHGAAPTALVEAYFGTRPATSLVFNLYWANRGHHVRIIRRMYRRDSWLCFEVEMTNRTCDYRRVDREFLNEITFDALIAVQLVDAATDACDGDSFGPQCTYIAQDCAGGN